ncbi:MAG: calcium-binding protein, partial [Planctomycetia bacterium]|nr:calcium-binding protein [Planctomycetia bacterium]
AASIGFDVRQGVLSVVGGDGDDVAVIGKQGANIVASLTTSTGTFSKSVPASGVRYLAFSGLAGNDSFTNNTGVPSKAEGGAGNDTLRGGSANDLFVGGDGRDTLLGNGGDDALSGGGGDDSLDGGEGDDVEAGDDGNDTVLGGGGNDELHGGNGNDSVTGNAGNDVLFGEDGDDRLDGSDGRDRINGGAGKDNDLDGEDRMEDESPDDEAERHGGGEGLGKIATPIVLGQDGSAHVTGTSTSIRDVKIFSFTATTAGTLTVAVQPDDQERWAQLGVYDSVTRELVVKLQPTDFLTNSGQIKLIAGRTYFIALRSADQLPVGFTLDVLVS